jgi:hypothetical protein
VKQLRMMGFPTGHHYDMRRMAAILLSDMNSDLSRCAAFGGEVGTSCRCKI